MAIRGMSTVNMAVLLLVLLAMAKQSMQMSVKDPIIKLKTDDCKNIVIVRFGLILNSDTNEKALLDSGRFKPDKEKPYVDLVGRRFHFGTLDNRTLIVYVKTGGYSANAATTVQILLDHYPSLFGIISFGTAGSLNNHKLVVGDVAVPEAVAFTGAWLWQLFRVEKLELLVFGEFNYPVKGQNRLGSVGFQNVTLFSEAEDPKSVFWLNSTTSWYNAAQQVLKDLKLPNKAKVVFGLKGSSSDIYVRNKAYGDFLHGTFNAAYSDTDSAAIASTSLSNGKPFIVFRGVSNVAGVASSTSHSYLASSNAFLAAAKFIDALPLPRVACE